MPATWLRGFILVSTSLVRPGSQGEIRSFEIWPSHSLWSQLCCYHQATDSPSIRFSYHGEVRRECYKYRVGRRQRERPPRHRACFEMASGLLEEISLHRRLRISLYCGFSMRCSRYPHRFRWCFNVNLATTNSTQRRAFDRQCSKQSLSDDRCG